MLKLLSGIVAFHQNLSPQTQQTFARLALGQTPDALFIGCSDSRVDPRIFASTDPGDVFVHRNVGNLVPAHDRASPDSGTAAAVEFAVLKLNVADIIVCGHSECGAMQALLSGPSESDPPHLHHWLAHGEEALNHLRAGNAPDPSLAEQNRLSQLNVLSQRDHLMTYPSIRERVAAGALQLHGWWFDIRTASVYTFEEDQQRFTVIDEDMVKRYRARVKSR